MTASNPPRTALEQAAQSWSAGDGARLPDWVKAFADRCDAIGRSRVAHELGYSDSVVSQLLSKTYRGNLGRIEMLVRGAYLREHLGCPVLGDTRKDRCLYYQERPRSSLHAGWHYQLYDACRNGCPNFRQGR